MVLFCNSDYSELMKEVVIGELCCQSCLIDFSDAVDHRNHYREDLHRYNLKLKLKGKPPVSFEEFSDLQDDISSISGSDSDEHDEEDAKKIRSGSPKIIFQNSDGQKMSVFRCLLHSKKVYLLRNILSFLNKTFTHTLSHTECTQR